MFLCVCGSLAAVHPSRAQTKLNLFSTAFTVKSNRLPLACCCLGQTAIAGTQRPATTNRRRTPHLHLPPLPQQSHPKSKLFYQSFSRVSIAPMSNHFVRVSAGGNSDPLDFYATSSSIAFKVRLHRPLRIFMPPFLIIASCRTPPKLAAL